VVAALVLASHPGPTVVVTALSAGLLAGAGASVARGALATAAVLAGQLSVGWSNDWVDAGRDATVGRTDKPVVRGVLAAADLRRAALAAAGVCAVLSWSTGAVPGTVHLVAVAAAWAYNLGLKDSAWSWAPYAVAFGLLPVFLVLTLPGRPLVAPWVVVGAALLGVGAHVANVLPDLEDDAATGVHGLPHRLGRTRASLLAPAVLLAAVGVVVLGPSGPPTALGSVLGALAGVLAVAAGVVALRRVGSRVPFALSMAVAALCVVLLVAAGTDLVAG